MIQRKTPFCHVYGLAVILMLFTLLFESVPAAEAAWQPEILVGLSSGQSQVRLSANVPTVLRTSDSASVLQKFKADTAIAIAMTNGTVTVNGTSLKAQTAHGLDFIVPDNRNLAGQITTINGKAYRGAVRLQNRNGRLTVINRVPVEEYLRGVVPEEMPPEWNMEALKAQSVAARTFALKNRHRHVKDGYDLCALNHCQQYGGIAAERTATNQAIAATRGEAIVYRGQPIDALFHTDSGGMTENSENVWGSSIPYLRAVKEVYPHTQAWDKNITADDLRAVLARHGKTLDSLKRITLSSLEAGKSADRTVSGRVRTVRFEGNKGQISVSGNDLRSWLGLRSTLFQMTLRNDVVFITGYGWGHGLGLSQWGAKTFADTKHMKYADILNHYYTGTNLKKLY